MVETAAAPDFSDLARVDYVVRVNAVVDHVLTHLDSRLQLEDLARVARFSPFHFHRIFRSIMGETLADFVKRARLERAVVLLSSPERLSLTTIAMRCGFASSSAFSTAFSARYGVPPRRFDLAGHRAEHRAALTGGRIDRLPTGSNPDRFSAALRDIPQRRIAYLRALRPYSTDAVTTQTERMTEWARNHGVVDAEWLGIQWDDPEVVALEDCRYDVAVVVPARLRIDGGVSETILPEMRVAEVAIHGDVELELRAIDWLYRTWLPRSGYVPAELPAMEAWNGAPSAEADGTYRLRVVLPLQLGGGAS